jgi:beta-barrel assembly-enhancing protease
MSVQTRRITSLVLAVVCACAVSFPLAGPLPAAHAQLFGISEEEEIRIGREVESQLARKPGFVHDAAESARVTKIALHLAHVSERPNLPWTYHILNDSQVNALAAPGGFIFVTSGLLRFVKSDDELAFVLGHETTHVAHRHAVDLAQKDMELQLGALLISQLLFGGNMTASQLAQLGRALINAKYSREKEAEADHFGVIFAKKAGFDPTASVAFMERLAKTETGGSGLPWLASHPDTPSRVAALREELRQMGYQVSGPASSTSLSPGSPTPPSPAEPPPAAPPPAAAPPAASPPSASPFPIGPHPK